MLIQYPATFLDSLLSSSTLFPNGVFRVFYMQNHVICKQKHLNFFFSDLDSFSFSHLIVLSRTFSIMLKRTG